jgi:hypothetical protein
MKKSNDEELDVNAEVNDVDSGEQVKMEKKSKILDKIIKESKKEPEEEDKKGKNLKNLIKTKKTFSLADYKKAKDFGNTKFKAQEWLELPPAFQETTGVIGCPIGHITLLRGHSNSSKTTALILTAISAQKKNILPVFIITEMKWSWEHAKTMGFQFDEVKNKNGEIEGYDGFFIYVDRSKLNSIEDVAAFINELLEEQKKGQLPYDLLFLWDSIGSIPCQMSLDKGKNNNEWNAGAMSVQFGNFINQKIVLSRKEEYPYTNTLICTNKVWVRKPNNPMGQPVMENKGGNTMYLDATFVVTFGNIATSGINQIKAKKNNKEVSFGSRAKVQIEKNHINGISTSGKIIITPTGYINDDPKEIDKYKKEHLDYFMTLLGDSSGDGDFETIIEETEEEQSAYAIEPDSI